MALHDFGRVGQAAPGARGPADGLSGRPLLSLWTSATAAAAAMEPEYGRAEARDAALVRADQQPAVGHRQAMGLALDLARPQSLTVGWVQQGHIAVAAHDQRGTGYGQREHAGGIRFPISSAGPSGRMRQAVLPGQIDRLVAHRGDLLAGEDGPRAGCLPCMKWMSHAMSLRSARPGAGRRPRAGSHWPRACKGRSGTGRP